MCREGRGVVGKGEFKYCSRGDVIQSQPHRFKTSGAAHSTLITPHTTHETRRAWVKGLAYLGASARPFGPSASSSR